MTNRDDLPPDAPADALDRHEVDARRAVLAGVVVAAVVVAAVVAIYHQRRAFSDAISQLGLGWLLASFSLGLIGVGCTYPVWRCTLAGLGVTMPRTPGAWVFFTSQLGKYVPGSIWPIVVQMEAGRARGASRRTMLAANLLTIFLSCTVGLILAAALLPAADSAALHRYWWLLIALPFLLGLLHPRTVPWALDWVLARLGRSGVARRLPPRAGLRAGLWSAVSFIFLGAHIALLAMAMGGFRFSTLVLSVGGMALAVSLGVLFVPAPAGAGVRDGVLAFVLTSSLTSGQALAVVVTSRALLVTTDLLLATGAGWGRIRDRRSSSRVT